MEVARLMQDNFLLLIWGRRNFSLQDGWNDDGWNE